MQLLGIYLWYKKEQVFKDRTVLKNFEENIHDETIEVPKNDIIPDNKPTEQNNQENLNQEI